jgi:hypothetical protein
MTPENAKAQKKAIEALIAASLRAPGEKMDVTDEEISRYVDQRVTLSSEEEAALEKSKPALMQSIKQILRGNEQENEDLTARPSKAERTELCAAMNRKNKTNEFSKLTESELDRKRNEMLTKLRQRKSHTDS